MGFVNLVQFWHQERNFASDYMKLHEVVLDLLNEKFQVNDKGDGSE
jgi:hypothetical protein